MEFAVSKDVDTCNQILNFCIATPFAKSTLSSEALIEEIKPLGTYKSELESRNKTALET